MTEQWIEENLPVQDGNVILEISSMGSTHTIPVSELTSKFADVEPEYDALVSHDEASGYKRYFDAWEAQGILS